MPIRIHLDQKNVAPVSGAPSQQGSQLSLTGRAEELSGSNVLLTVRSMTHICPAALPGLWPLRLCVKE